MSDMDLPLAVRMMQDGYLMEIDKLQAENESLRKELAVTNPLFETLNAANDRLIYENMKLRELVRDYEQCSMHADCSRCEYDGKMSTHCPFSPCFPDADELRELGVEV